MNCRIKYEWVRIMSIVFFTNAGGEQNLDARGVSRLSDLLALLLCSASPHQSTIQRETALLSSHIVAQFLTAAFVSNVEELRSVIVWLCQYATCLLRNLQQAAISSARDIASFAVDRAGKIYITHASEQLTCMLNTRLVSACTSL